MHDVLVIGAGAAGLFFSGVASAFGLDVLLLDHQEKIGEKIRISGGGRCNFTNIHSGPEHFLSQNPQFAQTAFAPNIGQKIL
jgi:Predicted flavoproteins